MQIDNCYKHMYESSNKQIKLCQKVIVFLILWFMLGLIVLTYMQLDVIWQLTEARLEVIELKRHAITHKYGVYHNNDLSDFVWTDELSK